MKLQHLFDAFNAEAKERNENIVKLGQEKKEASKKLITLNKEYENYIENGDDARADEIFDEINETERNVKMLTKKIASKQNVSKRIMREKVVELAMRQTTLKDEYKEDQKALQKELDDAIEQYNKVVVKINKLNDEFQEEFDKFAGLSDAYNLEADKDNYRAMRNAGYRPYPPHPTLIVLNNYDKDAQHLIKFNGKY